MGSMPGPEAEEVATTSSSYEDVAEEPEAEAPAPPGAAAKAVPKAGMVHLSSPSTEAESSAEEETPRLGC